MLGHSWPTRSASLFRTTGTTLVPPEHDGPAGEHVVLPARERSHVVVRRAGIEVTSLASQGDPTPDANVDARAEIEDSASKLPGCRIWWPLISVVLCS